MTTQKNEQKAIALAVSVVMTFESPVTRSNLCEVDLQRLSDAESLLFGLSGKKVLAAVFDWKRNGQQTVGFETKQTAARFSKVETRPSLQRRIRPQL
jgi:hypothetical protein